MLITVCIGDRREIIKVSWLFNACHKDNEDIIMKHLFKHSTTRDYFATIL